MYRLPLNTVSVSCSVGLAVLLALACESEKAPVDATGGGTGVGGSGGGPAGSGGNAPVGGQSGVGGDGQTGGGSSTGGVTGNGGAPTSGGSGNSGGAAGGGGAPGTGGSGASGTGGAMGSNPVAGTDSYDCAAPDGTVPALMLTEVASVPLASDVTHAPNDDRLFISTLDGDIRIVEGGQLVATPFLSLGNKVVGNFGNPGNFGDERGFLGLAFHPDYASNGLFYVHYSGAGAPTVPGTVESDTVIEEYKVSADANVADPSSARLVLTVSQPVHGGSLHNHNGGALNFGPDGMLYIGLGDGGGSGDPEGNAQNKMALLGKILRINPLASGGDAYTSPEGNLDGGAPEVWDYGLRNPFRSSFDGCTGDYYIGDVGQGAWEEIDIEKAGEGHQNYGWNTMEGLHCYSPMSGCDESGITLPLIEMERGAAQSITGGAVYRGASIPSLRGAYFFADYVSNGVWWTRYDRDAKTASAEVSVAQELDANSIVSIRNGNDGELYFASIGQGKVYRLASAE